MVVMSNNFCRSLIIMFCSFKFEKLLTIPKIVSLFNLSLCFHVVSGASNFSSEWCFWTVNLYSSLISSLWAFFSVFRFDGYQNLQISDGNKNFMRNFSIGKWKCLKFAAQCKCSQLLTYVFTIESRFWFVQASDNS